MKKLKRWLAYEQAINYFVHEFHSELSVLNAQAVFSFGRLEAVRAVEYCEQQGFDPELTAQEALASFRGSRRQWRKARRLGMFEIPMPQVSARPRVGFAQVLDG